MRNAHVTGRTKRRGGAGFAFMLLLVMFISVASQPAGAAARDQSRRDPAPGSNDEYVQDEVLVRLVPSAPSNVLAALAAEHGLVVLREYPRLGVARCRIV